ncbi:MAG TPA: cupin domain-containing protein [Flavisolibacter sp.]|nr:cupin domain-containing protein [Flavisolibacter sp.]
METKSSTLTKASEAQVETLSVIGHTITIRVGGEQTEGAYSVFELSVPPSVGTGLHIDKDWDEYWHVIEGRFAFTLNETQKELDAGGFAYGPKGIPHSFRNVGESIGKLLMITTPSGLEKFFKNVHYASLNGRPDKESFVNIMRSHHIEPA